MTDEMQGQPGQPEQPEQPGQVRDEIRTTGEQLLQKIKEIIHEGNVRSITIKDKDGRVIFNIPMTFGILGVAFAPQLAAIGAAAALLTECTITVVRNE